MTAKVKGMEQTIPVQWDIPKSPMQLEAEERVRQERARAEQQKQQEHASAEQQRREAEERARQEKIRLEEQKRQEKIWLEEQKRQEEERKRQEKILAENAKYIAEELLKNMVNISTETFWMGTLDSDIRFLRGVEQQETPRHYIKLAEFAISQYPVTQAQWQAVMENNPSKFKGTNHPVENVSWNDVYAFCQKLSLITGKTFRLPTEAEWECACRAGTQTIWPFGNDPAQLGQYAWFFQNSGAQTHPVGQLKPNAWGLFDMLGNVWEWCADWFGIGYYANSSQENPQGIEAGQCRLLRGGAWAESPFHCRPAYRDWFKPSYKTHCTGFRVACSL